MSRRLRWVPVCFLLALRLGAQTQIQGDTSGPNPQPGGGETPPPYSVNSIRSLESTPSGVDWRGLFGASGRFLGIEHGFRLMTEAGTRSGLAGSFFENYGKAVGNLHGWADGDEFYVNYVGHPMQGSVAGFLWVQNDRSYRSAEFGRNRRYWRSRLRAAAFAWAYSEQFEIGIFSEASIGAIQATYPQQGFVDHVITPAFGLAWMIGEDVVDKYLIERIERATPNKYARMLARSALNPSRTFASVLQGNAPWNRGSRPGILSYAPAANRTSSTPGAGVRVPEISDVAGPAPFEFSVTFRRESFGAKGDGVCVGGGGSGAIRMSPSWQLVVDVGGCKMIGLAEDFSGDSLTYMVGPRFRTPDWGGWSADLQFLIGGNKLTEEHLFPQIKAAVDLAQGPQILPAAHALYTEEAATNRVAVSSGGGVNYKLNSALTIRVGELSYQHFCSGALWGRSHPSAVKVSSGVILRIGTW